jgi:hypothetical protein
MSVIGNFTYSGDPRDSDRDAVRFLIGDTDETDQLVSDEEIAYMLLTQSPLRVASLMATGLAKEFAGRASSKTVGSLTIKKGFEEKSKSYASLAARLSATADKTTAFVPYAGGISSSDKQAQETDTDWEKPSFYRGIHDHPDALTPFRGDPVSSTEEYR